MAISPEFTVQTTFTDDERVQANIKLLNKVAEVLVYFFSDLIMEADKNEREEILDQIWDLTCASMLEAGMHIEGINEDGDYIVKFSPQA